MATSDLMKMTTVLLSTDGEMGQDVSTISSDKPPRADAQTFQFCPALRRRNNNP